MGTESKITTKNSPAPTKRKDTSKLPHAAKSPVSRLIARRQTHSPDPDSVITLFSPASTRKRQVVSQSSIRTIPRDPMGGLDSAHDIVVPRGGEEVEVTQGIDHGDDESDEEGGVRLDGPMISSVSADENADSNPLPNEASSHARAEGSVPDKQPSRRTGKNKRGKRGSRIAKRLGVAAANATGQGDKEHILDYAQHPERMPKDLDSNMSGSGKRRRHHENSTDEVLTRKRRHKIRQKIRKGLIAS